MGSTIRSGRCAKKLANPRAALFLITWLVTLGGPIVAQPEAASGQVELPRAVYDELVEGLREPRVLPRSAPAGFALGSARVAVSTELVGETIKARITLAIDVEVLEDDWVVVPLLPAGTALESATLAGKAVQLLPISGDLGWSTKEPGSKTLNLVYRVDALRSPDGWSLSLPLPAAASIQLDAWLPGEGLEIGVIPAAGRKISGGPGRTRVQATLPSTRGVQIVWQAPTGREASISRSLYRGKQVGEAILWQGELEVELFGEGSVLLPVLPASSTLSELLVDGEAATALVEDGHFTTPVEGQGLHRIRLAFQVPVSRGDGPPRAELAVLPVPMTRVEIELEGNKDVSVSPGGLVESDRSDKKTSASVSIPMTNRVVLSWTEAVPEEERAEVRANASVYHTVHAEEGVLYVTATSVWEITRGESNVLRFEVPPEVQVNRVFDRSQTVADWRLIDDGADSKILAVFLDRQLQGEFVLRVEYDRSLEPGADDRTPLPLLRAAGTHRQRGMIALLSSQDLTLSAARSEGATRVGENQLPAFVRQDLEMTVAHTFKYVEQLPQLSLVTSVPERRQGRFDAQVDTLISLGEGVLTGSASVELNVKSGSIQELGLELPEGVNLLSLSAPSMRTHRLAETAEAGAASDQPGEAAAQLVTVEFTQEMEGQLRVELTYERINTEETERLDVPTLRVVGAEVEQGRIAVEALTAVEVQPELEQQLLALDPGELPRRLVLRTTNPILLAYQYVHAEPEHQLALRITRHRVLEVQEAAIDRAHYRTLFTRDGLAVTTADLSLRNSRKQFLKVHLPEGSKIWSVWVDGQAEKPALVENSDNGDDEGAILVTIVTSTRGFDVRLVYATEVARIGGLGRVGLTLPRPDILVTETTWDVFLPEGLRYGAPSAASLNLTTASQPAGADDWEGDLIELADDSQHLAESLAIRVPTSGLRYRFEKLYANQSDDDVGFSISYASRSGRMAKATLVGAGTLMIWLGILMATFLPGRLPPRASWILALLGALLIAAAKMLFDAGLTPVLLLSVAALLAIAGWQFSRRSPNLREASS